MSGVVSGGDPVTLVMGVPIAQGIHVAHNTLTTKGPASAAPPLRLDLSDRAVLRPVPPRVPRRFVGGERSGELGEALAAGTAAVPVGVDRDRLRVRRRGRGGRGSSGGGGGLRVLLAGDAATHVVALGRGPVRERVEAEARVRLLAGEPGDLCEGASESGEAGGGAGGAGGSCTGGGGSSGRSGEEGHGLGEVGEVLRVDGCGVGGEDGRGVREVEARVPRGGGRCDEKEEACGE